MGCRVQFREQALGEGDVRGEIGEHSAPQAA
jgi:hypothetical protein